MKTSNINNYKRHFADVKNHLLFLKDIGPKESDLKDESEELLEPFNDAILDIDNSIGTHEEDLVNDSILHLTRLIKDTENKNIFNSFKNIKLLQNILTILFRFEINSVISRSTLEMVSYLSSTDLLEQAEILNQEQFFQYVVAGANVMKNPYSFIILGNFSLEREENARKCYNFLPPRLLADFFYMNFDEIIGESSSDFSDLESQREKFLLSVLSLLSSYCNYDLDENALFDILTCIKNLLAVTKGNFNLLYELFYCLEMLRINCKFCTQQANVVDLFKCFESLDCELSSEMIVTIFQYYGDSILKDFDTPELNVNKLIRYVSHKNQFVSGAAIWLIWTYVNNVFQKSSTEKSQNQEYFIHMLYMPDFFVFIQSIVSLNEVFSNTKIALLVLLILIENANSSQLDFCVNEKTVDVIIDSNFIEAEDQQLVFHIIMALNHLNNFYCSIGKSNFLNFLKSKFQNIKIDCLDNEHEEILAETCPLIMSCFHC